METEISKSTISKWFHPTQAWQPPTGAPSSHKLCVIVPFRESPGEENNGEKRERHLTRFYPYMRDYLTERNIPHIFIIAEQEQGSLLFNRGAILNLGFAFSYSMCDYVVFHDVDYLPISKSPHLYGFPPQPTHLSTNDHYKDVDVTLGGVFITQTRHQVACGGWSNLYWSWGYQDVDMYHRVKLASMEVVKTPLILGQYRLIEHPRGNKTIGEFAHPQLARNRGTVLRLTKGEIDPQTEGLASMNGSVLQIVEQREDFLRIRFRIHNRDHLEQ